MNGYEVVYESFRFYNFQSEHAVCMQFLAYLKHIRIIHIALEIEVEE